MEQGGASIVCVASDIIDNKTTAARPRAEAARGQNAIYHSFETGEGVAAFAEKTAAQACLSMAAAIGQPDSRGDPRDRHRPDRLNSLSRAKGRGRNRSKAVPALFMRVGETSGGEPVKVTDTAVPPTGCGFLVTPLGAYARGASLRWPRSSAG